MNWQAPLNPRYVLYCQAQGRAPVAQHSYDRTRWPGGLMCGFMLWINEQWTAWHAERGLDRHYPKGDAEHKDFDQWLKGRIDDAP